MGLLTQTEQQYYKGNNHGNYQFVSLDDIINQFTVVYVGEDKIISKAKRTDVAFHAQRAMQELSFDTFKSCKSQEVEIPPSLTMILPQDYINYTKISWVDTVGIKHLLYPTSKTSNPPNPYQNSDGDFKITAIATLTGPGASGSTITLDSEYKNITAGMLIVAPSIPIGTEVDYITHTGGITTVFTHLSVLATTTSTETITFENKDGSLIPKEESAVILDNLSWSNGSNKITQTPNTNVSSVSVGMGIDNQLFWPLGTTVIDVNGSVITMSQNALFTVVSSQMTFTAIPGDSDTWSNYKSTTPSENQDDYIDDTYWPAGGERYGLDSQYAQVNGSFYIDKQSGKIHFSSNISGKTVVLDYISDGLGTDAEMQVHKFAEEAMYKWIAYGILSSRINTPEYIVNRFKKEKFAETRKAKLRLSNIKLEEITQVLRGKSKQIKH